MNIKVFNIAKKIAKLSQHPKHQMSAIIVKKGKIQSFGINKLSTHPKSNTPFKTIHAEFHAILNAQLEDYSGCEMYIYRETKSRGFLAPAKPCAHCMKLLKGLNFKTIHFSDYKGFLSEAV